LTWTSKILNPNQANFGLSYYIRYGNVSDQRLRVVSALLTQILKEPAFNVLRTKEQLGYVVFCSGWALAGASEHGLRIVVQSERTAAYCEDRVEAFLDTSKTTIAEMTSEVFEEQKAGLGKKWLEAMKNLSEEAGTFTTYISSGHLDFLRSGYFSSSHLIGC
jgi:insulysin